MKEIILIGTLHKNWTPREELEEVLNDLKPNHLLVELSPEEFNDRPREQSIRDEMFAACDWASKNSVPITLFDIENTFLKEGVTGKEPEFFEHGEKSKEILKKFSWKELNEIKPWQNPEIEKLEQELEQKYYQLDKIQEREQAMLKNIQISLVEGINVILTGTGHLSFFKKEFPDATMPFRNN